MNCVCGHSEVDTITRPYYYVTAAGETKSDEGRTLQFGICRTCGIIRLLDLPFSTKEEHSRYYADYPPTKEEYAVKGLEHDTEVAQQRCDSYRIGDGRIRTILDIGSGSGAFVAECRRRGNVAFGCELAKYFHRTADQFIYNQRFEEIHFPTDNFDLVACHDVLEHVLDPVAMLAEVLRVVKQEGIVIVDFPRFHHESGAHHWKTTEHIWFFTEEQLVRLLERVGFIIEGVTNPIESKVVVFCKKPVVKRPTILVPPGIGDSYWSIVKMEAFLQQEKLGIPDVIPVSNRENKHEGHRRSIPFIQMFPFMHATGATVANDPKQIKIWNEAYALEGRTVFRDVMGYDYFLSYNGHLRVGKTLESIDPQLACNWHPPMFVSLEQEAYRRQAKERFGRYIVCYFPFYGTYTFWTKDFPFTSVVDFIARIEPETGCQPIMIGAGWDSDDLDTRKLITLTGCTDLTGKTNLDEVFGLIKGAEAMVGYPSGMPIMSAMFGTKTLLIWNGYYNFDFAWNCVPPDTRGKNYFIDFTPKLSPERLIAELKDLIENGTILTEKFPMLFNPKAPSGPPMSLKRFEQLNKPVRSLPQHSRPPRQYQVPDIGDKVRVSLNGKTTTVACVLKSGGVFNSDYVIRLRNMIRRHTSVAYDFVCLTDVEVGDGIRTIPLKSNLAGWWSKLELFRPDTFNTDRIVYLDLDTVIVSNIDSILVLDAQFAGLGGWQPGPSRDKLFNFGSGMLVWTNCNSLAFLLDGYDGKHYRQGDQEYIASNLVLHGWQITTLQDVASGIYSYKRNCLRGLPPDAKIVCFHGRPRPHEIVGTVKWVLNCWK